MRRWIQGGGVALFLTLFVGSSGFARPTEPTILFVYTDWDNLDGTQENKLYTMNLNGENPRQITFGKQYDGSPAWSPDGKFIVHTERDGGKTSLVIRDSDGNNPKRLSLGAIDYPSEPDWSPDGEKIVFTAVSPGNQNFQREVFTYELRSQRIRHLKSLFLLNAGPRWSPDGTRILFASGSDLFVMNANGVGLKNLTESVEVELEPAWSPDGKTVAFVGVGGLFTMRVDGRNRRLVSDDPLIRGASKLSWSADGQSLLLANLVPNPPQPTEHRISVIGIDGSGLRTLRREQWPRLVSEPRLFDPTLSVSAAGKKALTWGELKESLR